MVLCVAWVACAAEIRRKERKRKDGGERDSDDQGEGLKAFEHVPWEECDEDRPRRPAGFVFVLAKRSGWRRRLG